MVMTDQKKRERKTDSKKKGKGNLGGVWVIKHR